MLNEPLVATWGSAEDYLPFRDHDDHDDARGATVGLVRQPSGWVRTQEIRLERRREGRKSAKWTDNDFNDETSDHFTRTISRKASFVSRARAATGISAGPIWASIVSRDSGRGGVVDSVDLDEDDDALVEGLCDSAAHGKVPQTAIGLLVAVMSGTYFAFGLYATDMRVRAGFTQSEIQTVGLVLDIGVFALRPFTGLTHDALGPLRAMGVACVLGGTGYLLISSGIRADIDSAMNSVGFFSFSFVLVGIGGSLAYTAAIFTITSNWAPASRSIAVSMASASMGMSSFLVGLVYHFGFSSTTTAASKPGEGADHLADFFLVLSLLMYAIYGLGYLWADIPNYKPKKIDLRVALANYKKMFFNQTFWEMAGPFALVQGIGLMACNNMSSMAKVVAPSNYDDVAFICLTIYALTGTAARLTMGQMMKRRSTPTGWYMVWLCGMMAVSQTLFGSNPSIGTLYFTFLLVGASAGATWTICITMLKMFAPVEAFGQAFGLLCCMPAFSGLTLNAIAARLYEQQAAREGVAECMGPECYALSLSINAIVSVIATIWAAALIGLREEQADPLHNILSQATIRGDGHLGETAVVAEEEEG